MKQIIVLASNNQYKIDEFKAILGDKFIVKPMSEYGMTEEIPEVQPTIRGNAISKVETCYKAIFDEFVKRHVIDGGDVQELIVVSDDTGIEIDALAGQPGVHSARYAFIVSGNKEFDHDFDKNNQLVLRNLEGETWRSATMLTTCALKCSSVSDRIYTFDGRIEGELTVQPWGHNGFGYDEIFVPDGYFETLAEMQPEQKNRISQRAFAAQKVRRFLEKHQVEMDKFNNMPEEAKIESAKFGTYRCV